MQTTRLIEDYLDGILPAAERAAVESRAAIDSEFRELIRLHQEVNESIRDREFAELKKISDHLCSEWISSKKQTRRINPGFLRIAALFVLIAGSAALIKSLFFDGKSPQHIYKDYYEIYESDGVSRSAPVNLEGLDHAIANYNKGRFDESLVVLDELVKRQNLNYMAWFYRGLASLETNDPIQAIYSFKTIPDSWNSIFREHRDWYLALALLKNNNIDEAGERFTSISNESGYYSERSAEILKKLTN